MGKKTQINMVLPCLSRNRAKKRFIDCWASGDKGQNIDMQRLSVTKGAGQQKI